VAAVRHDIESVMCVVSLSIHSSRTRECLLCAFNDVNVQNNVDSTDADNVMCCIWQRETWLRWLRPLKHIHTETLQLTFKPPSPQCDLHDAETITLDRVIAFPIEAACHDSRPTHCALV